MKTKFTKGFLKYYFRVPRKKACCWVIISETLNGEEQLMLGLQFEKDIVLNIPRAKFERLGNIGYMKRIAFHSERRRISKNEYLFSGEGRTLIRRKDYIACLFADKIYDPDLAKIL